ncbi:hypothetical protein ACJZTR_02735 [Neorickettsia risticii]|uniref:Uncharacterized protein n=1 Tax=Neorickettsia risticii (strain Illinois) TaxID=434131 RepID=C6V5E2_NEORI|nr:hypothetical protein [Neorickettsia risticii]ACT69599.1 conserved hypothetical protein [Neorickettsia risticii str. Illinois]
MPHPKHRKPVTLKEFLPEGFIDSSESEEKSSADVTSGAQGGKDTSNNAGKGGTGTSSPGKDTAPLAAPVSLSPEMQYLKKIRQAASCRNPFGPFPQSKVPFSPEGLNPSETAPASRVAVGNVETHETDRGKGRGGGNT